jgi:hypothetical protein
MSSVVHAGRETGRTALRTARGMLARARLSRSDRLEPLGGREPAGPEPPQTQPTAETSGCSLMFAVSTAAPDAENLTSQPTGGQRREVRGPDGQIAATRAGGNDG